MDDLNEDIGTLKEMLESLQTEASGAQTVVANFTRELGSLRGEMTYTDKEVKSLSRSFGSGLRSAFDGLVFDGMKLSDALESISKSMVNSAYSAAIKPVQNAVGGALASGLNSIGSNLSLFADGGAFTQGRASSIASGIASQPTSFPMRGGMGMLGEAGPEAIMPLSRGPDGKLGVRTEGGSAKPVTVVMNISTPDAQSFRRSQSQVAAEMSRALGRGQRNR